MVSTIVANISDGIIVIDDAGLIQYFDPDAERCFGYGVGEVLGRNVSMLMPEPYRGEHDGYVGNYLKTGEAKIIGSGREVVAQRKDGTEFPIELSICETSLMGKRRFVGTVRDISGRLETRMIVEEQRRALLELSTPVIGLWDGIVIMPLIGAIDTGRARQITEALLNSIGESGATVAILDITGVPVMDTNVAQLLFKTVAVAHMLGCQVILTGISPETAQTLVKLGIDLSRVLTRGTLAAGVAEAFALRGLRIAAVPRA